MYPDSVQKLIDQFSKFPTIGQRTAARFVFYLMKKPEGEIKNLIQSILNLREAVMLCPSCFNSFEAQENSKKGEKEFCPICSNPARDKRLLCLVANEIDLAAIEKTKKYRGLFFVLGGLISTLKQDEDENLRIKGLEEKIKNSPEIKEIILALNPTTEGESSTLYLERLLGRFGKKISRLGRGLPFGGELEYADEETLEAALEGRK